MLARTHTVLHEEKHVDALDTFEHGTVKKMLLCSFSADEEIDLTAGRVTCPWYQD